MAYLFLFCLLISSASPYSLKINPQIQTAVNSLSANGQNNQVSLSQVYNSTILQAIPEQLASSHYNEIISFSVVLVIFSIAFLILGKIINQQTRSIFKLHQRLANLEEACFVNLE